MLLHFVLSAYHAIVSTPGVWPATPAMDAVIKGVTEDC